jgi:hypothetical protein
MRLKKRLNKTAENGIFILRGGKAAVASPERSYSEGERAFFAFSGANSIG